MINIIYESDNGLKCCDMWSQVGSDTTITRVRCKWIHCRGCMLKRSKLSSKLQAVLAIRVVQYDTRRW